MKRRITSILFASSLILSLASCSNGQQKGAGAMGQQEAMPYPVSQITKRTITTYKEYPTSIEGTLNSAVRAKASGFITHVLVDEGQTVKKGQALFKLETQTLDQEARAAQANLNALQVELNKLTPLVEKGIVSEVQLETAKANYERAKAAHGSIMSSIGFATVTSPTDGHIGKINFREGSLISPQDPTPLTQITNTEDVYAFFSLNERDYLNFIQTAEGETLAEKVKSFPKVKLQLVNGSIYEEEGVIETVSGQVDPNTGTVSFRATFPNSKGLLANGNSGKILIPSLYENALIAPASSSFEQQGITYMLKVKEDNTVESTIIEIQDRVGNIIILESGLNAGDNFVAQGVSKIRNNQEIVPQPIEIDQAIESYDKVFK